VGTLFVVGTPIGNLEDVSFRALSVLSDVGLIAAEDTRITRRLLARYGLSKPLVSFHEHSSPERRAAILARLAQADVALVTDAGTPGVSDPGASLVAEAAAAGHPVVAVPGPSAVTAALSVSGLAADRYLFIGFPPRRSADRKELLASTAREERTLVLFEAPHRLRATLADLLATLGPERRVAVCRELTKAHEQVWHGDVAGAARAWNEVEPRGEFVLVIEGAPAAPEAAWSDSRVREAVRTLVGGGMAVRQASRLVAARSGRPARDVYALAHGRETKEGKGP
jgi:16S rRNA (cytidine1402-2'-O)-methyltransferase